MRRARGWLAVVAALLTATGCFGPAERQGIDIELHCTWAGIRVDPTPPDVTGHLHVEADSPAWANTGSQIPYLGNVEFTDVQVPDYPIKALVMNVAGATWDGTAVSGQPALTDRDTFVEPHATGTVTATKPGHVVATVDRFLAMDVILGRPIGYSCTPTNHPGSLADIEVR